MQTLLFKQSSQHQYLQTQTALDEKFRRYCEHINKDIHDVDRFPFMSSSFAFWFKLAIRSSQQSYQDLMSTNHKQVDDLCLNLPR